MMKKLSYLFGAIAVLLSHVTCATVAYSYRDALCAAEHKGASAPASVAFFYAIPYAAAIISAIVLSILCYKKSRER